MTFGACLVKKNNLEAIIITDSRGTYSGRESDAYSKIETFEKNDCHGALFGSGSANLLFGAFREVKEAKGNSIEKIANEIRKKHERRLWKIEQSMLDYISSETKKKVNELHKKANSEAYPLDLSNYFQSEITNGIGIVNNWKDSHRTEFLIAGVDAAESPEIKMFYFSEEIFSPIYDSFFVLGSAQDASEMYFLEQLTKDGLKNTEDLIFHALNGFHTGCNNVGVGGLPSIVIINKDGIKNIPKKEVIALMNLTGAYLSGYIRDKIDKKSFLNLIKEMYNENPDAIKEASKITKLNTEYFKKLAIPYSSWRMLCNGDF